MVVGFNHNFRYKGDVYHIQTEDSGLASPNIVTLLYRGGTILASKKTSYADIAKIDNLEQVVEELMKEQHKNMLRSLKAGEFDEVIARFNAGRELAAAQPETETPPAAAAPAPAAVPSPATERPSGAERDVAARPVGESDEVAGKDAESPAVEAGADHPPPKDSQGSGGADKSKAVESSLDEVILSYLMGDEK